MTHYKTFLPVFSHRIFINFRSRTVTLLPGTTGASSAACGTNAVKSNKKQNAPIPLNRGGSR